MNMWCLQCFNSLHTGNHIQSETTTVNDSVVAGFNSLHTGNHIQRRTECHSLVIIRTFQFPSYGKPYPKYQLERLRISQLEVSIPFIRETISKGILMSKVLVLTIVVSIPFKRERISKGALKQETDKNITLEFQFPSYGKPYPKCPTQRPLV